MAKGSETLPHHLLEVNNGTTTSLQSSLTGDESMLNHLEAAKSMSVASATVSACKEKPDGDSASRVEGGPEEYEDHWETDPDNPRNWPKSRKWIAVTIVSTGLVLDHIRCLMLEQVAMYSFITPLSSSMMAPGLPQVAEKYDITNPTILALTLSIFLISYAMGVSLLRSED